MISKPSAIHSVASRTAAGSLEAGVFARQNTISGSIFGANIAGDRERAVVPVGVSDGVVVHVRPHQRLELERAPHRLVGVADLPADGPVTAGPAAVGNRRLDRVSRRQIDPAFARRRHGDDGPRRVGVDDFPARVSLGRTWAPGCRRLMGFRSTSLRWRADSSPSRPAPHAAPRRASV